MSGIATLVGLGRMGSHMAKNLAKAGFLVKAFDKARIGEKGLASSLEEAVADSSTVITALPTGEDVCAVVEKLFDRPPTVFIDCSTISPEVSRRLEKRARDKGHSMIDAPMSGGVAGARAGTLTFMVGGDYDKAEPYLRVMGNPLKLGGPGTGQAAKVCNNLMMAIQMVAVCEGFTLAQQLGLSDQALFDVAKVSTSRCWSLTDYAPVPGIVPSSPANRDYEPGFSVKLMLKDLRIALESGTRLPLGEHTIDLYEQFLRETPSASDVDFSGIIRFLQRVPTLRDSQTDA